MSAPTSTRPSQATLACWMVIGGSVFVVLSVYQRVAALRSIESREAFEEFLAEPPGSQLGIGVPEMIDLVQLLCLVAGGTAAAMTVLGVYAMRGSTGARLGLSVLCVPLVLAGMGTAGFLAPLVAAGVLLLWFQPTRDWFAGRAPQPAPGAPAPSDRPVERTGPPSPPAPPPASDGAHGDAGPRAVSGFGAPGATQTQALPRPAAPGAMPPTGGRPDVPRPSALTTACVVTFVSSGLVTVLLALAAVGVVAGSDALIQDAIDDARRQSPELADVGLGVAHVKVMLVVMIVVLVAMAGLAAFFAAAALRRRPWGHVGLAVMAGVTAGLGGLLAFAGGWPVLLPAVSAVLVTALLLRPEVRRWVYRS